MWKFKFGLWAVVLITSVFSFSACGDDDDNDTFVPPANIEVALKQLYPGAQNIEWEVKGVYYVADCWVTGDELEVWFDVNANWVMTENELDNVNQLVPAVYTAFVLIRIPGRKSFPSGVPIPFLLHIQFVRGYLRIVGWQRLKP